MNLQVPERGCAVPPFTIVLKGDAVQEAGDASRKCEAGSDGREGGAKGLLELIELGAWLLQELQQDLLFVGCERCPLRVKEGFHKGVAVRLEDVEGVWRLGGGCCGGGCCRSDCGCRRSRSAEEIVQEEEKGASGQGGLSVCCKRKRCSCAEQGHGLRCKAVGDLIEAYTGKIGITKGIECPFCCVVGCADFLCISLGQKAVGKEGHG